MFNDSLLESSGSARGRKRWPMATAFTLEMIIAAVVVIVPLLSTGVIPLSARVNPSVPLEKIRVERVKPKPPSHSGTSHGPDLAPRQTEVVLISDNPNAIHIGRERNTTKDPGEAHAGNPYVDSGSTVPCELVGCGHETGPVVKPDTPKRVVSVLSEAQLVDRVEPVYPKIAITAGVQGQVKLHAIIARDGHIISLNVISGHPLLVHAAEDAVRQWRYRPYYLNGQPVEVETFITVNFKREGR